MITYPADCDQRKIGTRAAQILHYKLDADHWEYKQVTGNDVGRDCILELSENNQWKNHKIEGQIKGKREPNMIQNDQFVSFPMDVKTINYALQSSIAFVLFVVDTTKEIVYYQPVQEYAIANPQLLDKLSGNQKTVNIRIPKQQILSYDDRELQGLATKTYKFQEDGLPIAV